MIDFLQGYLRAGKALQRMKKFAKARNIYEYGLQNVKTDDPDRQVRSDQQAAV